jgi:hypothetical protein
MCGVGYARVSTAIQNTYYCLFATYNDTYTIAQNSFTLLGEPVSIEYCKQRKGSDMRETFRDQEGDWACFKVGSSSPFM